MPADARNMISEIRSAGPASATAPPPPDADVEISGEPPASVEAPFLDGSTKSDSWKPPSSGRPRRDKCRCACNWALLPIYLLLALILLALAYLIIDPRSPEVEVVGTRLSALRIHTLPRVSMDIQLALQLSIRNPNLLGFEYDHVRSAVGYRGQRVGEAETTTGGVVRARSSKTTTVELDLVGSELLENARDLLADVARRKLPIEANSTIYGAAKVLGWRWKLTVAVDCNLIIDPVKKLLLDNACSAALL